jgi:hypothetical protein
VSYFSSSGNADRASYESVYRNSNETLFVGAENRGILHDFNSDEVAVDYMQSITVPYLSGVIYTFQWDDPFFSVSGGSGSASDLDFYIVDSVGTTVYAQSITRNIGDDPVEVLQFTTLFHC